MQTYSGPKTRNLERYKGDGFEKQGRVGYTEERGVFIQQSFTIKQKKIPTPEYKLGDEVYELIIRPVQGFVLKGAD